MAVADCLIWELVKDNHAHLTVRGQHRQHVLSGEPYNLTNWHSSSHSGYAHRRGVDVSTKKVGGKEVVALSVKKPVRKAQRGGAESATTFVLNKRFRRGANAIKAAVKQAKRPSQEQAALSRFTKIKQSQARKVPTKGVKKTKSPRKVAKAKARRNSNIIYA